MTSMAPSTTATTSTPTAASRRLIPWAEVRLFDLHGGEITDPTRRQRLLRDLRSGSCEAWTVDPEDYRCDCDRGECDCEEVDLSQEGPGAGDINWTGFGPFQFSIFDGEGGVDPWPDFTLVETEAYDLPAAITEVAQVLAEQAECLSVHDGYAVGQTILARIWVDGVAHVVRHTLTAEELGVTA